jgi:hypothetical protein
MTTIWYGPAAWEGPEPRRYGPLARVAVISDVHANLPALTAVLADIETAGVDLVISCCGRRVTTSPRPWRPVPAAVIPAPRRSPSC